MNADRPALAPVKLADVARAANTSIATVSRALNDNSRVDPDVAARVRLTAKQLGYRPNHLARNLRRRRTSLWLLIISDIENSFFTSVARGVEDTAVELGYSVVLCNADEDAEKEAEYIELAVAEHAAGVIISPHSDETRLAPLLSSSTPVVVIDREVDAHVDTVIADSRGGARAATEHLIAQGWRRPACITGPRSAGTAMLRRLGYEDALLGAGIRTPRVTHCAFQIDDGRAATAALLDRGRAPDAFVLANAALGLGAMQELRARRLRPGRDIGMVCFDDAPWAPYVDPPMSVVSQPANRIGVQAAQLLADRIVGAAPDRPHRIVLGTDLIVRESSLRHD